jgi:hypothetical protein
MAKVVTNSWAGRREIECKIVGETSKRYRVRLLEAATLPNHKRYEVGDVALVPKSAVKQ